MKKLLLFLPLCLSFFAKAQTYPSFNINLLGMISPNVTDSADDRRHYSGCWGWYQQSKNKEYAISGTSKGTYFIDITVPSSPTVCAYVEGGREHCIWRELKSYSHYCYVVSDDATPNKFQIIDMQYLPDSVHLVYSGTSYFERAHTIWIDGDKLYAMGVTYTVGANPPASPMIVLSLANPEVPVVLRRLEQDIPSSVASYVHDMYSRHDTLFASCANQGLQVFKFNATPTPSFTQLGSFAHYDQNGYNHSSTMTQNGKYLMFCDESPPGLPFHLVDIENLSNIQPIQIINPYPGTTPHNPYMVGNDHAVLACYQDGLLVYNIADPFHVGMTGYFDTYPQGGHNAGGNYSGADYRGNWGAYPWLPSGRIIAQDMQNGVFILDATTAFSAPVGIKANEADEKISLMFYPNPASNVIALNYRINSASQLQVKDMLGRVVYEKNYSGAINEYMDVSGFANGCYVLSVSSNGTSTSKQLIIKH